MDSHPAEASATTFDLASVQPHSGSKSDGRQPVPERVPTTHSPGRTIEVGKRAITRMTHHRPPVLLDEGTDRGVMEIEPLAPCLIADLTG